MPQIALAWVIITNNSSRYKMAEDDLEKERNSLENTEVVLSVMLAVDDTPAAVAWYKKAFDAELLWDLGSVAGLKMAGAVFFLGEPVKNGWESPAKLGITTTRIEVFCDDPDKFIDKAVRAGANGRIDQIKNHEMPWGIHRQGGFLDPFGHRWLVGDRSPLESH